MENVMKLQCVIGILLVALAIVSSAHLSAQNSAPGPWQNFLIPDSESNGQMVYDNLNHVTWLTDGNLASMSVPGTLNFRFGLPVCPDLTMEPTESCVNSDGSMNYTSAVAWVAGMNAANYLGHSTWQLPTAPRRDKGCSGRGPSPFGENFAFGCKMNALGSLYYVELGFSATETAIPFPPNTVGPFTNLQPNLYWSHSSGGGHACADTHGNFSFASGAHGGGCGGDYADVLPMLRIKGEISGGQTPIGGGLVPNGATVYDPGTMINWLANANLAATWVVDSNGDTVDTFGLPLCTTAPETIACVALDGSMNYESATAFINAMNHYEDPITHDVGCLGHKDWELPPLNKGCATYGCVGDANPMGNLYYAQLHFTAGTPVVPVPDIAVGPFHHLVPFPYWQCLADTIQDACEPAIDNNTHEPGKNSEWGFSFGTGFLGTERLTANHYVTVYFVGCDLSTCQTITFAPIKGTEDALTSLTLTATASSGLAVSFTSITPKVCTISGNTASLVFPGTCTIEASQAGDESWESALPIQQTLTVNLAQQTITFPPIKNQTSGATVNLHATASSGLPIAYSAFSSLAISNAIGPAPVCELYGSVVDTLATGTCTIEAYQAGNDLYAPAFADRSFTVTAP
jgi:hypothetical protein